MKYVICVLVLVLMACEGKQGEQGSVGEQGPPGINHVPVPVQKEVTWVQFCPGQTTYPTIFVEGGFCIDNKVYAVYSTNNGFMTYLPPGAYQSNAVNSACNFILLDDCTVQ